MWMRGPGGSRPSRTKLPVTGAEPPDKSTRIHHGGGVRSVPRIIAVMTMDAPLRLFVYGTLKRGFWNHRRFCDGFVSVQDAAVCGRLYEMPSGLPALLVPEESVLAEGSADIREDLQMQEHPGRDPADTLQAATAAAGEWMRVSGELFTFDDPKPRLRDLDWLEGFQPGELSFYRRVLVPVETSAGTVAAWTYIIAEEPSRDWRLLRSGAWPEEGGPGGRD